MGVLYVLLLTLWTSALPYGHGRQPPFRLAEGSLPLAESGTNQDPADCGPLKLQSYEDSPEEYAEVEESNSSDYVRQYSYDPSMKDPIFARCKRKSEPRRDDAGVEAIAEQRDNGLGLSRAVAGCVPRGLQDLARNYKLMVAATKQFIKAANRTVMERVLEECGCVSFLEASTCEPPIDIACLEHRSRRKEIPQEEEYEEYEEEGPSSKAKTENQEETSPVEGATLEVTTRKRRRKLQKMASEVMLSVTMQPLSDEAVLKLLEAPAAGKQR